MKPDTEYVKKLIDELKEVAGLTPPVCRHEEGNTGPVFCKPFEDFQDLLLRAAHALESYQQIKIPLPYGTSRRFPEDGEEAEQVKPMVKFKRLDPSELPVELQDIKPSDVKPLLPERGPTPEDLFVVSKVVCKRCYRKWMAVRLAETPLHELECPECGPGYVEETGDNIIV